MKDEAIKNSIDASVEAKTKELTEALEGAVEDIDSLLTTLRHEISVKHPRQVVLTLQALAQAAASCTVIAKIHASQLAALLGMQEEVNSEQKKKKV